MKKVKIALVIILPLVLICCILGVFLKKEKILKEIKNEEVSLGEVSDEMYFGEILEGVLCSAPLPKESYQYDLDLVEDNQVVFAYRYTNWAWGKVDELLLVNKNNQCKLINLLDKKCPDNQDSKILEFFDSLMQDDTYPYGKYNSDFTKDEFIDFINIPDISLENEIVTAMDMGEFVYFYVSGNQENRKINIMKVEGDGTRMPQWNRKNVNEICDRLERIACENSK